MANAKTINQTVAALDAIIAYAAQGQTPMADHFLGINRGKAGTKDSDLVYGTSTGSTDIELRIGDALALTRQDVRIALKAFERFLVNSNPKIAGTLFPPAT